MATQKKRSSRAASGRKKPAVKKVAKRTAFSGSALESEKRIHAALQRIPRGRVSNYGAVADVAGLPGRARLVGTLLRKAPASLKLPWQRVVNAQGHSAFPDGSPQRASQYDLLRKEGVKVSRGRIDMQVFGWPDRASELDELIWGEPRAKSGR
jgi:methylated-DNA-protein-cysteine methyltransferase related protein